MAPAHPADGHRRPLLVRYDIPRRPRPRRPKRAGRQNSPPATAHRCRAENRFGRRRRIRASLVWQEKRDAATVPVGLADGTGGGGTLEGDVVDAATGARLPEREVRVEVPRADPVYAKADDHRPLPGSELVPGLYAEGTRLGYLQAVQAVQLPVLAACAFLSPVYAVITAK